MVTLALAGCLSENDHEETGGGTTPPPPTTLTVSGAAVGGPITGQVCAYTLNDAGAIGGTALACTATNATTGAYSLTITGYTGNILLRAFGTYLDEATATQRAIAEADAIRAMVTCATAGSTCTAAVTPLTEAAIRLAGTLTRANIENAYRTVAQAFGLNPSSNAQAVTQLVSTLPNFASRTDAAATAYADLLALASQAQVQFCGATATCTLGQYLGNLQTVLGGANGIVNFQTALNQALQAWSTNPHNTTGVTCALANGVITCTLPTNNGGNNGGGSGGSATGNYRLTVTVTAAGVTTTALVLENVAKPDTQDQFCNLPSVTQQVNTALGALGTFTINRCTFSGTAGTIAATVNITQPIAVSVAYTVNYTYTQM